MRLLLSFLALNTSAWAAEPEPPTAAPAAPGADPSSATAPTPYSASEVDAPAEPEVETQDAPAATTTGASKSEALPQVVPPASEPVVPTEPEVPLETLFTAQIYAQSIWNFDPGFHLFSADDVEAGPGVSLGVDVLELSPEIILELQLGYSYSEVRDGNLAPDLFYEAALTAHRIHLGVVPRVRLWGPIEAHVRLQGGVSFTEFVAEKDASDLPASHDTAPLVGLGAGVSFVTAPKRLHATRSFLNAFSFGVQLEAGMLASSALSLAVPNRAADPPERRIATSGASLGELDRIGPYLNLGVLLRL